MAHSAHRGRNRPPAGGASGGANHLPPEGVREALSRVPTVRGSVLVVEGAADVVSNRFPPGEYERPTSQWHLLALRPSGPGRRVWRLNGLTLEGTTGPDDVGVVPAGQPFTFEVRGTIESLSVVLHTDFVGRIAERAGVDPGRVEVLGGPSVPDPQLARLVRSFLPEMGGEGLGGELYAAALATQIALRLLRRLQLDNCV